MTCKHLNGKSGTERHRTANICYAEVFTKRRSYAVLHVPPVDSREKAVRASIVQHFKKGIIT